MSLENPGWRNEQEVVSGGPENTYFAVNNALNRVIFDGRFKLAPVFIDIEGKLAEDFAAELGISSDECETVIARTVSQKLDWSQGNPYLWFLGELEAWNNLGRFEPPPFTALLAILSLAAEKMRADGSFSAQNYYVRLFEILRVSDETHKNNLRFKAKHTEPFWQYLNRWLAERDFEAGRPTARRVNEWKYVSYAISQALVRDGDRKRFHSLFLENGLAPHEKLTDAEMTLYLHDWMRGAGPSSWLKKIWGTSDLRSRVAAAACAELESWDGASAGEEGTAQTRRLSWAASVQTFPVPKLRLYMSAAGSADKAQIDLTLASGSPPAAAAFRNCTKGLWLSRSDTDDLSVLEPVHEISLSALMLASFELKASGNLRFNRASRPIVPLVRLDDGALYREVSRVSFLRSHLILCHETWRQKIHAALTACARQGFKSWLPENLKGLPPDWALFSGVEILRLLPTEDADLQALVPLSDGAEVEAAGGLRLSYNLWHAGCRPEITAVCPTENVELKVLNMAGDALAIIPATGGVCQLALRDIEALDSAADLVIAASVGGKVGNEIHISLRSALQPKRLAERDKQLAYRLSENAEKGLISATYETESRGGPNVRGMVFEGNWKRIEAVAEALQLPMSPQGAEELPVSLENYRLDRADGPAETCAARGRHFHWICQEFNDGDSKSEAKWMTCRHCGYRVLTRGRGRAPKRENRKTATARLAASPPPMVARNPSAPGSDLVFDGICYLGSGTWRKLLDLASLLGAGAEGALNFANSLIASGHIDAVYDEKMRNPISWTVAPPALVFTNSGSAFLAGFRNDALVSEISSILGEWGATSTQQAQEFAPPVLAWRGVTSDEASELLSGVRDPHKREVKIVTDFAAALASTAPRISQLAAVMRPIRLGRAQGLERFDPFGGTWTAASKLDREGAYRTEYNGRRYVYWSGGEDAREGSYSLVKLLAARASRVRLHGYEAANGTFFSVLGCDPPGLLSRALVACSGHLPIRNGFRAQYSDVAANDAALILEKLYS